MSSKKLLITFVVAGSVFISGCEVKDVTTAFTAFGGTTGATVVNEATKKFPAPVRTIAIATGAWIGSELGKQLGKYLSKPDYENIGEVVSKPEPQTATWCAGTRGFAAKPTTSAAQTPAPAASSSSDCQSQGKSQVIVTTKEVTKVNNQECREYLTEVKTPQNEHKTVTDKACRGADGKFAPVTTIANR